MEVSFVEITECCRCCMNFSEEMDNIFECFYKNLELNEILNLISGLKIYQDDGFPQSICDACKDSAMRAYDFRETCIKSENEILLLKENEVTVDAVDSPEVNEEFTEEVIIDIESSHGDEKPSKSCPFCQDLFSSSQQLALHVITCNEENYEKNNSIVQNSKRKHECHVCGKKFESHWKTRRHLLVHKDIVDPAELPKVTPKEYKYECQECGKRVETPSKLQRHMAVHDKKSRLVNGVNQHRPIACPHCPQRFWNKVKLDRHCFIHSEDFEMTKIAHPPDHMFVCVICLAKIANYEEHNEHMKAHREELGETSSIACRLCNRVYPKLANVIRHSRLHEENATNRCLYCAKAFGFGDDFIDHMMRHKGFKPFACTHPGCNKSFIKAHKLRFHMSTHKESLKLYRCDKCDKTFAEIDYLKKHLFRHLGVKPFACSMCPAKFSTKAGLNSHSTTHSDEKKYACELCDSKFRKVQTLNLHMKIHRNEKAYACEFCDMRFVASGALKRHLRRHTLEKPYTCSHCDKAYAQSNDLVKHMKVHLGPNVYVCSLCPEAFPKYKDLKNHKMEHYKNDLNLKTQGGEKRNLIESYSEISGFV